MRLKKEQKFVLLLIGVVAYLGFIMLLSTSPSTAEPGGADITPIGTSEYDSSPGSRTDDGGLIVTANLDITQQEESWKAYVGNLTGTLVLRNSDGRSIFEWALDASTMSGNVFVTRNDTISWASLRCANNTIIEAEQTFLGLSTTDSYSINQTFNYTTHQSMSVSGVGTITNSTCPSTATFVNGSSQTVTEDSDFQEILLTDTNMLIYGTFIYQDSWGYDNNESVNGTNVTYDYQVIVAENRSTDTGHTYYFYADIS